MEDESNELFLYLFDRFRELYPKIFDNADIFDKLLEEAIKQRKLEIGIKILQLITSSEKKKDFSIPFIQSVASNSTEICQYFIENKVFINYYKIINMFNKIMSVDEKTFSLFINNITPAIKQIFIENYLSNAIRSKNLHLIEYLLKENSSSECSLIEAVKTDNIEVVNTVLKYIEPFYVNQNAKDGTALFIAVKNSNIEIVKRLLSIPEINVNIFNKDSTIPLSLAIQNVNTEIIGMLLDIYEKNPKMQTTQLNQAIQAIFQIFSKAKKGVASKPPHTYSFDDIPKMLPLLKRIMNFENVDLNCSSGDYTILSYACNFNEKNIVSDLLKTNRVDVNLFGPSNGNTALMNSIKAGNYEIARMLIEYPLTDINLSNYENKTALTFAVENDSIETVDLLIHHNKFDPMKSRLDYAFYISKTEIMKELIKLESLDVNFMEKSNHNYFAYNTKLIAIITSKLVFANYPSLELIDLIIKHPSFDKEKSLAKIALFLSLKQINNTDITLKLLSLFDDDVNVIDYNNSSLLVSAVQNKNIEMVKYILSNEKFDRNKSDIKQAFDLSTLNIKNEIGNYIKEYS